MSTRCVFRGWVVSLLIIACFPVLCRFAGAAPGKVGSSAQAIPEWPFVFPTPQQVEYGALADLPGWKWSGQGLPPTILSEIQAVCGPSTTAGLPLVFHYPFVAGVKGFQLWSEETEDFTRPVGAEGILRRGAKSLAGGLDAFFTHGETAAELDPASIALWGGPGAVRAQVARSPSPALRAEASLTTPPIIGDQEYWLTITTGGGEIRAMSETGLFYALQSLRVLQATIGGRRMVRTASIHDWPAFAARGLITGPWWVDRMSQLKMNLLQYPYARDNLTTAQITQYRSDAVHARSRHVRFLAHLGYQGVFGSVTLQFNEAGFQFLRDYYTNRFNWGAREFTVGFDDMSIPAGQGATWGTNHSTATVVVRQAMQALDPSCTAWLIPVPYAGTPTTSYSGASLADGTAYLQRVGAILPPDVQVFWTGPGVFSPTVTDAQADAYGALIGRPPFFWDNDPLNWVPSLSALHGRPVDFYAHVGGYVGNIAGVDFQANCPAVMATIADYLWNPHAYDPATALERASAFLNGLGG